MTEALETAQDRDNTVFVFASGNDGWFGASANYARYAGTPRVISVGASTIDGRVARYSNGGASLIVKLSSMLVDTCHAGSSIWMVAPAGDFDSNTTWASAIREGVQSCGDFGVGTSWVCLTTSLFAPTNNFCQATPMVSGAAAILRSVNESLNMVIYLIFVIFLGVSIVDLARCQINFSVFG